MLRPAKKGRGFTGAEFENSPEKLYFDYFSNNNQQFRTRCADVRLTEALRHPAAFEDEDLYSIPPCTAAGFPWVPPTYISYSQMSRVWLPPPNQPGGGNPGPHRSRKQWNSFLYCPEEVSSLPQPEPIVQRAVRK